MPAPKIVRPLIASAVLGLAAFLAGYYGPLYLSPGANQGPLFGIFIAGPFGLFAGLVLGIALIRASRAVFIVTIAVAAVIAVAIVLYLSLPEDRLQTRVVEGEVRRCSPPTAFVDGAIATWNASNADTTWRQPRGGWRDDIPRMLASEPGVVVTIDVRNRWYVWERRKPWNRNTLRAALSPERGEENYFVRSEQCGAFQTGRTVRLMETWEHSKVSPPDVLPAFLGLSVLRPVPPRILDVLKEGS